MRRKVVGLIGLTLVISSLMFLSGAAQANVVKALQNPCSEFDPNVRSAASDVRSAQLIGSLDVKTLRGFAKDGANVECRRTGLDALTSALFESSRGLDFAGLGAPVGGRTAQAYHDFAAGTASPELGYAIARAVVRQVRSGFAIVPGGAAEAFNRIQTCLDGKIVTNQGNRVAGVALNCGSEVIRRAVADEIAKGFYLQFGSLPAVNFGCNEMLNQATSGKTVEARWAAAQAYVEGCAPNLADLAQNGATRELRFAAVASLATQLARTAGASAAKLLGDAVKAHNAGTGELSLANAWAAGLLLEKEVSADPKNCAPVTTKTALPLPPTGTSTTQELLKFSLSWAFFSPVGAAAIAPLARYNVSKVGFSGPECQLQASAEKLRLTIAQQVPGAKLPLLSNVTTL